MAVWPRRFVGFYSTDSEILKRKMGMVAKVTWFYCTVVFQTKAREKGNCVHIYRNVFIVPYLYLHDLCDILVLSSFFFHVGGWECCNSKFSRTNLKIKMQFSVAQTDVLFANKTCLNIVSIVGRYLQVTQKI